MFAINMTTLHRLANIGHKSCTGAARRCSPRHCSRDSLAVGFQGLGRGVLLRSPSRLDFSALPLPHSVQGTENSDLA